MEETPSDLQAGRKTPARRGAEPARLGSDSDLQSLLSRAVEGLARETRCRRVAAWIRDERGAPRLLAAHLEDSVLRQPDDAGFEAVAALGGATDLCEPGIAATLAAVAEQHGLTAAAPIRVGDGDAPVVLLVGQDSDAPGPVRPRTLAALAAAAERLRPAAATALAARRLARMDSEVQHLDRLAALGGLVAEIVHEIRNPLVSVKTFLQLLPERAEDPEFRESFLAVASEELRRIERLLDVVLEHGRERSEPREEARADAAAALDSVSQLTGYRAAERGVTLEIDAADAPDEVPVSGDALRQILLNLVLNAIAATPRGGTVRAFARAEVDGVRLQVEDDGPGIEPALRERIFEPFVSNRRNRPGGLGLAITRRIVEEAGGRIEVTTRPGGGAIFRVNLPGGSAQPAPSQDDAARPTSARPAEKK